MSWYFSLFKAWGTTQNDTTDIHWSEHWTFTNLMENWLFTSEKSSVYLLFKRNMSVDEANKKDRLWRDDITFRVEWTSLQGTKRNYFAQRKNRQKIWLSKQNYLSLKKSQVNNILVKYQRNKLFDTHTLLKCYSKHANRNR